MLDENQLKQDGVQAAAERKTPAAILEIRMRIDE